MNHIVQPMTKGCNVNLMSVLIGHMTSMIIGSMTQPIKPVLLSHPYHTMYNMQMTAEAHALQCNQHVSSVYYIMHVSIFPLICTKCYCLFESPILWWSMVTCRRGGVEVSNHL